MRSSFDLNATTAKANSHDPHDPGWWVDLKTSACRLAASVAWISFTNWENVLGTCETFCRKSACAEKAHSVRIQETTSELSPEEKGKKKSWQSQPEFNHRAHLQNIHLPLDYMHCTRLPDKCVDGSRFPPPGRPLSAPPWEPVCPACHAREKEHRHHFDCSPQPRHCRSTLCQAHSLLVSKISHSGQGNCRA